jgi:hypothetical protein
MHYIYGKYDPEQLRADDELVQRMRQENEELDKTYHRRERYRLQEEMAEKERQRKLSEPESTFVVDEEF